MRVETGCFDGSRYDRKDISRKETKRTKLKESAKSWNDAGSTIVAGMLQVRPKGATQVAPVLFWVFYSGI